MKQKTRDAQMSDERRSTRLTSRAPWPKAKLSEVALGIFDGPHATPPPCDTLGHYFLGIPQITPTGHIDLANPRFISEGDYAQWTKRVVPREGDVVFSYEATLNLYAMIPKGMKCCLGRRMGLVRPDNSKLDSRFLYYYFFSPEWRRTVVENTISGATVDRLPIKTFPSFPISLPPLSEQRRIVGMLSAYDDLIENNRKRIALLEESARQLYKEWFVRLRFPGHERHPVEDGVPKGWKRRCLPDMIEINPLEARPKAKTIRYVPMSALSTTGMTIDLSETELRESSTSVRFRNGDTLLARITPCLENGKTGYASFLDKGEVACGSTEFIVLRGRTVPPSFVYCLARTDDFRETAIKSMVGSSGRQRVQPACFDEYPVLEPDRAVLKQFDRFAGPVFAQIATLRRESEKLAAARDALLPRLMKGECVS